MIISTPITRASLAFVLLLQAAAPVVAQEGTGAPPPVLAETDTIAPQDAPPPTGQDPFYCAERKLGTWFYCESPKPKSPAKAAEAVSAPAKAIDRLALITKALDELRARAILEPSTENVAAYIRYQREQLDRASTFADVWQRAIWQDPSLDYTLQRPVNTLGKNAWLEARKNDQAATMAALSRRYGLFFFYSSSCGACEAFSPVLKGLSEQYALSVLPISMDGGPNATFRNYVVDHGQYQRMGLQGGQVPALVLFDTVTKKPIPVGYGVMAADEVMQRIFTLTSVKVGSDY
ncbi:MULTISPECIES: conjugal transfer protein TraF [unclassified Novosphingobium]|uniref:conjugal transfer protein TraF n=1 Tax=unclassified Novosphingobium TaxID=2644732 RepID=UPI000868D694|nr:MULTISPECIES: conjugal transfer protein TraF [unclassified Novosphingobium]MBN9146096.1 conjugal transfer protein TraF [Novosphingobium sp.]ODU79207.1 MAG: conjugal transfer protein TraF [Novosphingobium sp. SCN 63-17]OJX93216.1 MAG: conjugal transfer protein TraF [Novosphingobium sp. 63-713]